jgi:hypothetical protein
MTGPSTGVTWVNSGLAVLGSGGVMTNHPTSSFGYEEAARAGAAPTPHRAPARATHLKREAATRAASRDTALQSVSSGTHSARRR